MNHNVYEQLLKKFDVHLIQRIDPPYAVTDKYLSKACKVLGIRRTFPAFTEQRLKRIKKEVLAKVDSGAAFNFYHGATPWLLTENKGPYATYLDCCFGSYIRVYHKQDTFSKSQLNWLFNREAAFLNAASCVFFSSRWALDDTIRIYKVAGTNFCVAGLGGGLDAGTDHKNSNEQYFLFTGLDFFGKGGDVTVQAFSEVQKHHPSFKLKIVGEKPPESFLSVPNVEYAGRFNKSHQPELDKLIHLFQNAFCFIHPTTRDMTPLVLVEAASAGVPSIATNSFGIPEIVKHNVTGLLVDASKPLREQLASAMIKMITNPKMSRRFSENAKVQVRDNFSWDKTGKTIHEKIKEFIT